MTEGMGLTPDILRTHISKKTEMWGTRTRTPVGGG